MLRIEGYASLFDQSDLSNDCFVSGAFKPIKQVRMLWNHDPDLVIGRWNSIFQDSKGLFVAGEIGEISARSKEVISLAQSGAIDGLSVGFKTIKSHRENGTRKITEASLWEVSLVTFPMLQAAKFKICQTT